MKTVDFGKYKGNGSQVTKESGRLAANEEVLVTWIMPDVCTDGDFVVIQSQGSGSGSIHATFHNQTKVAAMDVRFGFGAPVLVPNSAQSATVKVDAASSGLLFELTVKSR